MGRGRKGVSIEEIKRLLDEGKDAGEIAELLGYSKNTIQQKISIHGLIDEDLHTCVVCGKKILVVDPAEYVYKWKDQKGRVSYTCSWSHYRIGKPDGTPPKKKKRRKTADE